MILNKLSEKNEENTSEKINEIKDKKIEKQLNLKLFIIRAVLIFMLLETFYIIFGFSNQNGDESKGVSRKVSEKIIEVTDFANKNNNKVDKVLKIRKVEPIIRKLAHFSLYTVVGVLLMSLASTYNLSKRNKYLICLCLGCLYACSDEIHQIFVKGRSGQVMDVLIDTFGVLIGSVIINNFLSFYKTKNKCSFFCHFL